MFARSSRVAVLSAVALVCSACSGAPGQQGTSPAPSTSALSATAPVRANARPGGPSLLPADIDDPASRRVAELIYRSLFVADAKGKLLPAVATTMTSDDGRVWRIETDPNAVFSTGETITAQTVADSWAFTAARTHQRRAATPLDRIEGYPGNGTSLPGVEVIDAHTLEVTLAAPTPGYDTMAGDLTLVPLPSAERADPARAAVRPAGNGPYLLGDDWTGGGTYTLRPSGAYTGKDQPANTGLTFTTYPTLEQAYLAFGRGELDVLDELPPSRAPETRATGGTTVATQPVGVTQSLDFPMTEATWTGARGRERRAAISMAIDRAAAATAYAGARTPATDLAAPVVEGYSADMCGTLCSHDPRTAARMWQPVATDRLEVAYAADGTDEISARQVCAGVEDALTVPCTLTPYPNQSALAHAVRSGTVNGPYIRTWQMTRRSLGGFLAPRYSPGAAQNWGGWTDRLAQTQLQIATTAPTETATAAYQAAERLVLASLPSVPLWSINATTTAQDTVDEVLTDATGEPVYRLITRPGA